MKLDKVCRNLKKSFTLRDLPSLALLFVIAVIVVAVGGNVLEEVRDTQTTDDYGYNATVDGLAGIKQLAQWFEIIALVIAATIVIGILMVYFGGFAGTRA